MPLEAKRWAFGSPRDRASPIPFFFRRFLAPLAELVRSGRMLSRTRTHAPGIPFKSFIFDPGRMLLRNSRFCLKKIFSPSASRAMIAKI
ncbi:unnamed protein product, partial [Dovyalis caffra]